MADRDICVTEEDYEKPTHLLEGARQRRLRDLAHVGQLDSELDRAHVVPAGRSIRSSTKARPYSRRNRS